MTESKPSIAEEWQAWCEIWDAAGHKGKMALATIHGISYDSARHWRSDCGIPILERQGKLMEEPKMIISNAELMGLSPEVRLDFVMFDIETSGFDADWDILLSACIKPYGQDTIVFRADNYPEWMENRADDRKITMAIAAELRKHAIVVGHYSEKFDVKFIRAKMFRHGLEPLPPMFAIDTWRIAKNNFKVSNRRMKSLSIFGQIPMPKEEPSGDRWMRASFGGDKDAMDKIVQHNIDDVLMLEKLASISFPYLKSIPRM